MLNAEFGWLGSEQERKARESLVKTRVLDFKAAKPEIEWYTKFWVYDHIWNQERRVLGRVIPAYKQEVGDCVSFGMKQAGECAQIREIASGRQEEVFREWFAPWIYAVSRNQIGGGLSGDGSLGAWAAEAVNTHGVLFADDDGVPAYSGSLARKWGSRSNVSSPEYAKFFDVASDNTVAIAELKSVEEIRWCLSRGLTVTIASSRGFRMSPVVHKGYHVFVPSGTWMHQMCFVAYNDDIDAFYRMNSWGPSVHGEPLNGEKPGGAWNLAKDVEDELRTRSAEVYALYNFAGSQGDRDFNIV